MDNPDSQWTEMYKLGLVGLIPAATFLISMLTADYLFAENVTMRVYTIIAPSLLATIIATILTVKRVAKLWP